MEIIRFDGIDKGLYELVAPVVMNPAVLRQNNNYPFKTTFRYVWLVAVEDGAVMGFMPLKPTSAGICIDNYYIRDDDHGVADALLESVVKECAHSGVLSALVHKRHVGLFSMRGFRTVLEWKNYDKMKYDAARDD